MIWITQWCSAGLRAGWSGFESRQGLGICLFTTASRTALGPTQPPIQWLPGVLSLEVQRIGLHSFFDLGTRWRWVNVFTRAGNWILSWKIPFSIILVSLFYLGFLIYPIRATFPAHLILLLIMVILIFREDNRLWTPPVIFSLLAPNILSALCPQNTSSQCFPSGWQAKFHIHTKKKGKIIKSLTFTFLDTRGEDLYLLLSSSRMQFLFVAVVPKYLNFATFSINLASVFMLWSCPAFWWPDVTLFKFPLRSLLDQHRYWRLVAFLCFCLWYLSNKNEAEVTHLMTF
jgi:hypothetical protein